MLNRICETRLEALLKQFPAVALLGPRQAGKTTLAKSLSGMYFDLEQESDRQKLDGNWSDAMQAKGPVILDEAQSDPRVFSRLRGAIDADRQRMGRFLILGSISPILMKQVSQSLAGRIGHCELTPISLQEKPADVKPDSLWLYGGYPDGGLLESTHFPTWQESYLYTLAHRDLPQWGLPANPALTQRLFRMLSHSQGQLWNASQIGQSLGLGYHTAQTYVDFLAHSFLIRFLEPFHGNPRQRLIKSPRVYWRDTGLLHALWGVKDFDDLQSRPAMGFSWEGWIIEQILIHLQQQGVHHEASFVRTKEGLEADLILDIGNERWAIETKYSSEPSSDDINTLGKAAELVGASRRVIVCRTQTAVQVGSTLITPLADFFQHLT